MSLSTIDTEINLAQIKDQVAMLLYSYGVVPERAEVTDIDFGEPDDHGVVPLKVQIQQKEVERELET